MDLLLNDEQRAVQSAVRVWVDAVVVPDALRNDREERFPQEALDGLRETGFVGMTIGERWGGGGADLSGRRHLVDEGGLGRLHASGVRGPQGSVPGAIPEGATRARGAGVAHHRLVFRAQPVSGSLVSRRSNHGQRAAPFWLCT